MKVWIRGKSKPWIFRRLYKEKDLIFIRKDGKKCLLKEFDYYFQTKKNIYKLSMEDTEIRICRLYMEPDINKYSWYPNPYSKYTVEKVEFLYGTYRRDR